MERLTVDWANGQILGGLSTAPSLDNAVTAYHDVLGLKLTDRTLVPPSLARSWGCEGVAGAPMAGFTPGSGSASLVRVVEQALHPEFTPVRTYGWAAFEYAVSDVSELERLCDGHEAFTILGRPKPLSGVDAGFLAMQASGPGQEVLFLNQVLKPSAVSEVPVARSFVDQIFIAVLAAADLEQAAAWYRDILDLSRNEDYVLPYSTINKAFGFDSSHKTKIAVMGRERVPLVEIEQ